MWWSGLTCPPRDLAILTHKINHHTMKDLVVFVSLVNSLIYIKKTKMNCLASGYTVKYWYKTGYEDLHLPYFISNHNKLFIKLHWWHWAFLLAQAVKKPPAICETWVLSLGWEDPLEEPMATHSSILTWRIPQTEEPGRLQSVEQQRVKHGWVTKHNTAKSV